MMPPDAEKDSRGLLDRAAVLLRGIGDRNGGLMQGGGSATSERAGRRPADGRLPATEMLVRSLGHLRIGDMPPAPPTLRAKIGAVFVHLVRRALFWYSAQVLSFQQLVVNAADEQMRALQHLLLGQRRNETEIADLTKRVEEAERRRLQLEQRLDQLAVDRERQQEALDRLRSNSMHKPPR